LDKSERHHRLNAIVQSTSAPLTSSQAQEE
jgi:hypothetical protein